MATTIHATSSFSLHVSVFLCVLVEGKVSVKDDMLDVLMVPDLVVVWAVVMVHWMVVTLVVVMVALLAVLMVDR